MFEMFLILSADDIAIFAIFANSKEQLQIGLDLLLCCCNKWKLFVYTSENKVILFRKAGRLPANV